VEVVRSPWRKLADWCLDGIDWADIFRVRFVMRGGEPAPPGVTTVAAYITVSPTLFGVPGWRSGAAREWPPVRTIDEIIAEELALGFRFKP
jgi:hypothetical protein